MLMRKRTPPSSLDALEGLPCRDWIRESTARQFDRHDGNAQRQNCDLFRDRFGPIESGPAYVIAQSGKTVWDSEPMQRMLNDARAQSFDLLLTGWFDRWQRNLRRTLEFVEDVLHPNGVSWVMVDRRLISGNPKDWQQMRKLADEAQAYAENLAEKVRDGYAAKLVRRHDQGGGLVGIGFKRDEETKLVIPDPDGMVKAIRVWELSAQGWTDACIAAEVGLTLWQVRKVLQSPLFSGFVRPDIPANFPAPIPRHIREQAQAHRRQRNRVGNRARTYRVYPLSGGGPAVCDECGRPIKGDTKARRNGDRVHVYRHADGPPCVGWPTKEVPAVVLEDQVAALLEGAAPSDESAALIRSAIGNPVRSIDRLAVARVDARLKQLGQELVAPEQSRTDAEILAERAALRAERDVLLATPVVQERVTADEAIAYLRDLGRLWRETDDQGRRMLAVATFSEIRVRATAVRGSHQITAFELTPDADRHGLNLVLTPMFEERSDEIPLRPKAVGG